MSVGCIPVLFHPEQRRLWPEHVADWQSVSVYLDYGAVLNGAASLSRAHAPTASFHYKASHLTSRPGTIDVLAALDVLPHFQVRRKREAIRRLLPRLVYAHDDGRMHARGMSDVQDAFDVLLGAVARHAQRGRPQERHALSHV